MPDKKAQPGKTAPVSGELSAEQLDDVSGGMAISPAVVARNLLTPKATTTGGSIAQGDTFNGGDMPSAETG